MSTTDKSGAIRNFRKVIDSMQREEMTMVMGVYADALKQIVTIARENSLSLRHIEHAMNVKEPKEKKVRVPRKKKTTDLLQPAVQ
jgi:hypothetical protein